MVCQRTYTSNPSYHYISLYLITKTEIQPTKTTNINSKIFEEKCFFHLLTLQKNKKLILVTI